MPLDATKPTYQLKLMENGIDFMKSGIETYFVEDTPDPRSHKYAILHMFSGVVLLLKERLARIHPSLVFVDVKQCGRHGARTTTFHQTLTRLEQNGITIDTVKRAMLDRVRELRNDIEHYEVSLDLEQTTEVIGELASFAYIFALDELQLRIDEQFARHALGRFYNLKEIGDRLMQELIESGEAEWRAEEEYFHAFENKYAAMTPDEILSMTAAERGVTRDSVELVECPYCYERTLVLLEVGACINPTCRATPRLGVCHYCQGVSFGRAYLCERCKMG
jgi:hypothetical protein